MIGRGETRRLGWRGGETGRRWVALGVLSLTLVFAAACGTHDPGARNTLGNVSAAVPATPRQAIAATERALRQLEMTIISSQATEVDGRVTARSPRRRPVDVRVTEDADNHSRVRVRIGAFGDEDASIGVLRRIRREVERDPAEYADFEYKFEEAETPETPEESNGFDEFDEFEESDAPVDEA